MKLRLSALLAGSSLLVITSALSAQAQTAPASQRADAASSGVEEIIVTARRKAENLQDVPETVDVVTAQAIQKYNLLDFTDVQKMVPGLQLQSSPNGFTVAASVRGVTYNETTNEPPTVTFYMNEAPIENEIAFTPASVFDIGQIEVLLGPQGTTRGEIAPSGSITITSARPDLEKIGGYMQVQAGNRRDDNFQGAVNVPIVQDKLALRVAGERDETDEGGVRSLFNTTAPYQKSESFRTSLRFQPTDDINAVFTWMHIRRNQFSYSELFGPGAPGPGGVGQPATAPPANYNGPALSANQLLSVDPVGSQNSAKYNVVTGQIDWNVHGQKVSYVGSWSNMHTYYYNSNNTTNSIPGYSFPGTGNNSAEQWSQELRLSSVDRIFGRFDYTVGLFATGNKGDVNTGQGQTFLAGAFGAPGAVPQPVAPKQRYALDTFIFLPSDDHEYAAFGSTTFHLSSKDEITAGVRYDDYYRHQTTNIFFGPAFNAAALPAGTCAAIHGQFGVGYPGICDIAVNQPTITFADYHHYQPVIYNFEASHHFNDDLMAYFKTGSSFRPGVVQVGTAVTAATTPSLVPYVLPKPETSKTYEIGVKSDWFDKRLLFDIDYYHQYYTGSIFQVLPFEYLQVSSVPGKAPIVSQAGLVNTNANAIVDGIEAHASGKITPHWSADASVSWSNGRLDNAVVPCNPPFFVPGQVPTVAQFGATQIFTCTSKSSTSTAPRWTGTISSEYYHPINDSMDGFVRGLLYYYPSNPNTSTSYVVPAYATLDVYLGVRKPDSAWQLEVYGKNITNNQTVTSLGNTQLTGLQPSLFGNTGYFSISKVALREFGIQAKYAFGSR